ncbi:MAG: YabP/YqfC family sporulation protein [Oscillospiraceae bacterium]
MKQPGFTYLGRADGLLPARSLICISGDKEVLIESCKSVIECNDIKCTLIAAGYTVDVWGTGLSVTSFANGNASVAGKIQSVSVERRSRLAGGGI